jgi:hypothetical protein
MYKVLVGAKEVYMTKNLVEACRSFLYEFKKRIDDESLPSNILLGTSAIETEISGNSCVMDTGAITKFCHAVGILEEDDSVSKNPPLSIPEELARGVLLACYGDFLADFLEKSKEEFAQIASRP